MYYRSRRVARSNRYTTVRYRRYVQGARASGRRPSDFIDRVVDRARSGRDLRPSFESQQVSVPSVVGGRGRYVVVDEFAGPQRSSGGGKTLPPSAYDTSYA